MKERHSNAVFNFLDVGSEGVFIPNNPVLIGSHPYKNCEKLSVEDEQKLQNFLSFLESLEKIPEPLLDDAQKSHKK